jgi:hydroxymethylbilane synthase
VTAMAPLRLGTRGSLLATTQSGWVADRIRTISGREVELVIIRTTGDVVQDRPLSEIGGQGLFTRELDTALLEERVDIAVHSLKDLPTVFPEGLVLAAVPEREDPRDVLIGPEGVSLTFAGLPEGARLGTGSLRRQALARAHHPGVRVEGVRGNLDTRIQKVDDGELDGIFLAAAGVRRLGWSRRISEALDPAAWPPAPGQGALAIVARLGDEGSIQGWASELNHPPTEAAVTAERTLLHTLEAGCQLPVAALGLPFDGSLRLRAMVADPSGRRLVRAEATGRMEAPEALGRQVAEVLLARGADRILADVRTSVLARTGGNG